MKKEKIFFKTIFLISLMALICASGLFFVRQAGATVPAEDQQIDFGKHVDMMTKKIINLGTPEEDADAVTKSYLDGAFVPGGTSTIWDCLTKDGDACAAGTNSVYLIDNVWNVGIGTNNPLGIKLNVEGNIEASGSITASGANGFIVGSSYLRSGSVYVAGVATVTGDLTVTGASTNFRNAIKAVDGSGSLIDADKLDAQEGSYYLNTSSTTQAKSGRLDLTAAESMRVKGIRGQTTNDQLEIYNKVSIGDPGGWGAFQQAPSTGLSVWGGANIGNDEDSDYLSIDSDGTISDIGGSVTIDDSLTVNTNLTVVGTFDPNGSITLPTTGITGAGTGSGLDADLLDTISSGSFLRSDASDNYTSGTLTFNSGTELDMASGSTLDVNGTLSLASDFNKTLKNYFKTDDTESFINIDDNMTIEEIAEALGRGTTTTGMTKVDDPTAPAPGAFQVSGAQYIDNIGPYWKVDQDSEYIFETWIKVVSSTTTPQRFYAGWNMYNASKVSFGNVQRYWGSAGTEYDSNSYNDGQWHHVLARISGTGSAYGNFIDGTEYARIVLLLNYNSGDTITRYAGMKFYKSKKVFSSIYIKDGSHSTVDSDGKLIVDYSGNVYANDLTANGNVGIGTTAPAAKLEVEGNIYIDGFLNTNDNYAATVGYVDSAILAGDAESLDGLDSTQFLRSDTSDNYTSGTLTFNSGTELDMASGSTLDVNGSIALPTTGITGAGSGSGLDADKLDTISSGSFLRSDASDSFTGLLTASATNRQSGIYGTYDSYKIDHIWSMGTGYKIATDGSDFGGLYGLAYKHTNNTTGGTMAGGHQMVWAQNGTGTAAMGSGLWTSGAITGATLDTGQGANKLYDMNQNVLTTSSPTFTTVNTGQGANELYDMNQNVLTSSGPTFASLTVTGKLTAGEVDPPYNIDGTIYATYGHSTTGLKEETVGKLRLQETRNKKQETKLYIAEIDFDEAEKESDLWLFKEITAFGDDWNDLVVSLTPEGKADVWYEFIPEENKLIIYGNHPVKVSYRLMAPRFDWPERDTNLYNQTGKAPEGVGIFVR